MTILIITLILVALYAIGLYNGLINKRNHAENAMATIDVMLKRRFDLIPNLVQTVKQYSKHESEVLSHIVELRQQNFQLLSTDEKVGIDQAMSSMQRSLQVMVEQYPDLKASNNFLQLQASLNETEEQLAAARRTYNTAATLFNIAIQSFPSNLIVGFTSFQKYALLETPAQERENVNVQSLFN